MGEHNVRVSVPSWALWLGLGVLALFLYLIRSILPPFVVGAFLAFVFSPLVARLQERWGLRRSLAILTLYLALVAPVVVLIALLGPRFVAETQELIVQGPDILTSLLASVVGPGPYDLFGTIVPIRQITLGILGSIRDTFGTPGAAVRLVTGFAEFALNVFLTLIVSIYLLGDEMRVGAVLLSVAPPDHREHVMEVSEAVHRTLARYFRRQLLLIGLVAAATFFGLAFIFHLQYALPLAVVTGLVEIVPFLGPVVAGSIAALIALSQGGISLLAGVVVFYTILRQIEDQVVAPVVLGRAVELHPLIVIFAVLAGGSLFGILGTLAAIPVAASIKVVADNYSRLVVGPSRPPSGSPSSASHDIAE